MGQEEILEVLKRYGEIGMNDLVIELGVEKRSLFASLKKLEDQKMIERYYIREKYDNGVSHKTVIRYIQDSIIPVSVMKNYAYRRKKIFFYKTKNKKNLINIIKSKNMSYEKLMKKYFNVCLKINYLDRRIIQLERRIKYLMRNDKRNFKYL